MNTLKLSFNLVVSELLRKLTPEQFKRVMFKVIDIPGAAPVRVSAASVHNHYVYLNHDHPDSWSWHLHKESPTCECTVEMTPRVGGYGIVVHVNDYQPYRQGEVHSSKYTVITPEELRKLGYV